MVYADRAFTACRTDLKEEGITLNCCDANAHVQFVERGIRFIKERIRCVRSMMPRQVKKIPHKLMRELVFSTVKMVNSIRQPGGVSTPGHVGQADCYREKNETPAISTRNLRLWSQG